MGKILHRYLLKEIIGPFTLILGIFLFVLLMGRILKVVDMIVRHGVSPFDILRMFAYLIPFVLPTAIPMALLIAGVICFSRLSTDQEIIALKASGISIYQLLPPVALFAIVMTLASLFLSLYGAPGGAFAFRYLALQVAKRHLSVAFKEGVFNEVFPGFVVYADRIDPQEGTMSGIFIYDQKSAEVPLQVVARKGVFNKPDPQGGMLSLRLENGNIYQVSPERAQVRRIHFEEYEINLGLTLSNVEQKLKRTRRKELPPKGLVRKIRQLHRQGQSASDYLIELHRRFSIPVTCLIFGILSLPLGLQSRPQGGSHGFVLGTLVIVVYYLLFSTGKILAETDRLPAWLSIWAPNILFGVFAGMLLIRTAKEKPSQSLVMLNALIDRVQRWVNQRLDEKP